MNIKPILIEELKDLKQRALSGKIIYNHMGICDNLEHIIVLEEMNNGRF